MVAEGFANPDSLTVPELGWRWREQRKLLKDLSPAAPAAVGAEPVRPTVVGPDPDSRPCPGARLVEREVVRDGRTVWVEEWRVTVSSVGELLELQSGLGAPVLLEGGRLTVMAEGA